MYTLDTVTVTTLLERILRISLENFKFRPQLVFS